MTDSTSQVGDEIDPIMDGLETQRAALQRKAQLWAEVKVRLLPLVKDLILLGCEVDMRDSDLNCRFSGDKQLFLRVVRAQFRHGMRPDLKTLQKGATEGYWRSQVGELHFWTWFSSTQCRRVQIGTKLEEVPIYETQCDSPVPDAAELPGFAAACTVNHPPIEQVRALCAAEDDDIPF